MHMYIYTNQACTMYMHVHVRVHMFMCASLSSSDEMIVYSILYGRIRIFKCKHIKDRSEILLQEQSSFYLLGGGREEG